MHYAMRIAILSVFYPYRGGIAQFNACLHEALGRSGTVQAFNFKRQYPKCLFRVCHAQEPCKDGGQQHRRQSCGHPYYR